MRLCHVSLPGLTSYHYAAQLQESIVQQYLRSKDVLRASSKVDKLSSPRIAASPVPTIITAEFTAVYTFGRRQLDSVSEEQRRYLKEDGKAAVILAQRGGQVTYHGPGQLVVYPIIDLRRHKIRPRDYVRLLEASVMSVCSSFGAPNVETTQDPGVWIKGGQRKICAVGVHIQRGVTAHGLGFNVTDRDQSLTWGFDRIVACGLEGKQATWLSREISKDKLHVDVEAVASELVENIASRVGGIEEIYQASGESILESCRMQESNASSTSTDIG